MNPEALRREIAIFQTPCNVRATFELVITLIPLLCGWVMAFILAQSFPLLLLLQVPITSAFVVRAFMILHDCAHYAFFRGKLLNEMAGRLIGVLSVTPYEYWRRTHAFHHASAGNIDRRGFGDVPTLTVSEYGVLNSVQRLGYRILRHPLVLFGIAPFYVFVLQPRLPVGLMRQGWKPWASTLGTNVVLIVLLWILIRTFGWGVTALATLPILAVSASIGVWLNFIQHNFEGSQYWSAPDWRFSDAALYASSHYVLPQPLRWLTADIGFHHIHHLNSRIPYYRFPSVMKAYPRLAEVNRVPVFGGGHCISRTLWDETRRMFVTPKEAALTDSCASQASEVENQLFHLSRQGKGQRDPLRAYPRDRF